MSQELPAQEFDVIIIGAGLAGGIMAWQLASAGYAALMLDAGQRPAPRVELVGSYARDNAKSPHSPYRSLENDRNAPSPDSPNDYYDQGKDPNAQYKSFYERITGGSTWHWLGHTPRLLPNDFRMQTVYGHGVDWPISYDDIEPWYCKAEAAIGVAGDDNEWQNLFGAHRSRPFPMSKIWPSYSDLKVASALEGKPFDGKTMPVLSTPSARNSQLYDGRPPCAGNSICVPICPIQAKYDATVHVNKALQKGATLWERCVVKRLDAETDQTVRKVTYLTWSGEEKTVLGKIVILAANAIETPKLLLLSHLANASGQVGCNLMDHLQRAVLGLSNEPLFPYRGPPSTSGIEVFRDGAFRKERSGYRVSLGNDGWSRIGAPLTDIVSLVTTEKLFGKQLQDRLVDRVTRQLRLSCSTEVLPRPENRVTLSPQTDALGIPRPQIAFSPEPYTLLALDKAVEAMQFILDAVGATERTVTPLDYSGAGHIMGTCRMGADPAQSVVDPECRAHEHPNLFIIGSSVFPTVGTPNPSLTIAALTLRAAETVISQLGGPRA